MFVFCNIDDTRGEPVLTVSVKHITCNVPEVVQSFSLKMGEMDSAIVDVLDEQLMDVMATADMLMNKQLYSDSYLKAYRSG